MKSTQCIKNGKTLIEKEMPIMKKVILGMAKSCRNYKGAKEPKIRLDILQMIYYGNLLISNKLCDSVSCFMTLPLEVDSENDKNGVAKPYDNKKFVQKWKNKYLFTNDNSIEFHEIFVDKLLNNQEKKKLMIALEHSRKGNQNTASDVEKSKSNSLKAAAIIEKKMKEEIASYYEEKVWKIDDIAIKEILDAVRWDYTGIIETNEKPTL